jgi:hypothetical protein
MLLTMQRCVEARVPKVRGTRNRTDLGSPTPTGPGTPMGRA